jgi:hypothetical protein
MPHYHRPGRRDPRALVIETIINPVPASPAACTVRFVSIGNIEI